MRKHNGMRPQDIVILLKIITFTKNSDWKVMDLVSSLYLSQSEISESLHRSSPVGLTGHYPKKSNAAVLKGFFGAWHSVCLSPAPGCIGQGNSHGTFGNKKEN